MFLVSKVLPANATRRGTSDACERSLERLRTDRLDLYLLHWRGQLPLGETIEAFSSCSEAGKIRHWGVSNFDALDLAELIAVAAATRSRPTRSSTTCRTAQAEFELLPWCRDRSCR